MEKTIGQQIEDAFLLHSLDLELLKIAQAIDYRQRFEGLKSDLISMIVSSDPMSWSGSRRTQNILFGEIEGRLQEFYSELERKSQKILLEVFKADSEFGPASLNEILKTDYFKNKSNAKDSEKSVKTLLVVGSLLTDLLDSQRIALESKIKQAISFGVQRGLSTDQIAARLRGTRSAKQMAITPAVARQAGEVSGFTFSNPITARSQSDAVTVFFTAMQAANSSAYSVFFEQNDDIFQGIQHKSVLDLFTSKICRAYANKCWDLEYKPILGNNLPYPGQCPLHFRCRSQHIPFFYRAKDLPADFINSIPEESRNALSKEQSPSENELSFNSWFSGIEKGKRIATVGKTFNSAWEKGDLSADQFLDRSGGISIEIKDYKQRAEKKTS